MSAKVPDRVSRIDIYFLCLFQISNMLYLEAPAGVGYSYSEDKNYTTGDDQVFIHCYMGHSHYLMISEDFLWGSFMK